MVDDGLGDLELLDGPWSWEAMPDRNYIDCGPLQLPYYPNLKIMLEFEPKTRRMGAVNVRIADCEVQLQVLAAPRETKYWPDLRYKLVQKLRQRPGHQQVYEGHFGTELIATHTVRDKFGILHDVPMRFVGIDGERWMLRAVVTGPSVTTDETIARVNAFLSQIAIKRGSTAMTSGSVMELTPPAGVAVAENAATELDVSTED